MSQIVEKDGIKKEIENANLVADYVAAGWKVVEKPKKGKIE